jgi:uncharacterized membrane protein YphA (DoxX/SURF4 family)
MKNKNIIIGLLILISVIAYPFIIKGMSPDHFNKSGDFLTYIFIPVLTLLGIFSMINLKSGVYYSRIIVGSVFIVSGLIKANDTLGFSYKLEEYFEPGALGWSFFEPYALIIAFTVCIAEVILGLALLFGAKYKITLVTLTGFLVFFGFLTFYTAQCDPTSSYTSIENGIEVQRPVQCVLDCGCFGDALKGSVGRSLTPWESFYKDLVLLVLTLFLYLGWSRVNLNNERRDKIILISALAFIAFFGGYVFGWWMPLSFSAIAFGFYLLIKWFYAKGGREWVIAAAMIMCTLSFALYTLYYLPVKDYRPYAIGNNIKELKMTSDDIKASITQVEYDKLLTSYASIIENEKTTLLVTISDTVSNYKQQVDSVYDLVNSKYEDIAWGIADSIAADSMVSGNLLPPVYAVNYLLRKKTFNIGKCIQNQKKIIFDNYPGLKKTSDSLKIKLSDSLVKNTYSICQDSLLLFEKGDFFIQKKFTSIEYLEQKLWNDWETVYQLKHNETGEVVKILSTEYDMEEWEAKNYSKINPQSFKVKGGYEPKVSADFDFNNDQANIDILNSNEFIVLLVAYKLDTNKHDYTKINEVYNYTQVNGIKFYAATSTGFLAEKFKIKNNIPFDFLSADEKILKTIVRSNPGMVLLKGGVVYEKWSGCEIPSAKKLEKYIAKISK